MVDGGRMIVALPAVRMVPVILGWMTFAAIRHNIVAGCPWVVETGIGGHVVAVAAYLL